MGPLRTKALPQLKEGRRRDGFAKNISAPERGTAHPIVVNQPLSFSNRDTVHDKHFSLLEAQSGSSRSH